MSPFVYLEPVTLHVLIALLAFAGVLTLRYKVDPMAA